MIFNDFLKHFLFSLFASGKNDYVVKKTYPEGPSKLLDNSSLIIVNFEYDIACFAKPIKFFDLKSLDVFMPIIEKSRSISFNNKALTEYSKEQLAWKLTEKFKWLSAILVQY